MNQTATTGLAPSFAIVPLREYHIGSTGIFFYEYTSTGGFSCKPATLLEDVDIICPIVDKISQCPDPRALRYVGLIT